MKTAKQTYDARRYKRKRSEILRAAKAYAVAHPEIRRKISAAYIKRNPDVGAASAAKRRAVKNLRTPRWLTADNFNEIKRLYKIARHMTVATGFEHEVDHIVPLKGAIVSGLHVPWNLQVIPASENAKKGNRL